MMAIPPKLTSCSVDVMLQQITRQLDSAQPCNASPLNVGNGLASPADAVCHVYCEIFEVIRCVAAPVKRRFEFSVVSCSLVPGKISPKMQSVHL